VSNDHYIIQEEEREQWRLDLEEALYEEWAALIAADPGYLAYFESLAQQYEPEGKTP
jgi:hypothetical protein